MTVTSPTSADTERRPPRPADRGGFEIAVLCSLTVELEAVETLFDHHWGEDGFSYGKAAGDPNLYICGVIGRHNVVLAFVGSMGVTSTAAATAGFRTTFPNIKLALIVGLCGAVPFYPAELGERAEIVLGDVIVSDNIVQCDFGRHLPEQFVRVPNKPDLKVRALLKKLVGYVDVLGRDKSLAAAYPGTAQDMLFEATYGHLEPRMSCEECGCNGELVLRARFEAGREGAQPAVHSGLIASSDRVWKSGKDRDDLARKAGVIGFEMQGIGDWDAIPCVVIKGVCDYADGHRNKVWQGYAAAAAAACMKEFLHHWRPSSSTASS